MAEKDSGRYRYEPYPQLPTKQQNNGTNSLKRNEPPSTLKTSCSKVNIDKCNDSSSSSRCCTCMGPKAASFWIGLLTNLGICTLLFAYTLLGKFMRINAKGVLIFETTIFMYLYRFIYFSGNRRRCIDNATTNVSLNKSSTSTTTATSSF